MLVGFVAWELRHPEPLMRFGIFQTRTVTGANVAGFILGTAMFSMFLMLTLYMQQVLGYSAMKTGVAYLAVAGTAILWSAVAAQLVTRVGVKPVLVAGMATLTAGLVYFTQVSVGGSYLGDLLPGFLLIGFGIGFSFVPISIAALAGVQAAEAGLASGLINTSQQIGGALGIAALSTIATTRTGRRRRRRHRAAVRARRRVPGRLHRRRDHRGDRNRRGADAHPSRGARGGAGRRARARPRGLTNPRSSSRSTSPTRSRWSAGAWALPSPTCKSTVRRFELDGHKGSTTRVR